MKNNTAFLVRLKADKRLIFNVFKKEFDDDWSIVNYAEYIIYDKEIAEIFVEFMNTFDEYKNCKADDFEIVKIHLLKIDNNYLLDIKVNGKNFEIRLNDRNYKKYEYIIFADPLYNILDSSIYQITYILKNNTYLQTNMVGLAIKEIFNYGRKND